MKVTINKQEFHPPQSWNDLNQKQLEGVMKVIYLPSRNLTKKKIQLLQVLLNLSEGFMKLWEHDANEFFFTELIDMLDITDFLFEKLDDNRVVPALKLTKNVYPSIRIGSKKLYGPADGLSNISFYEFTYADTFYVRWCKDKNEIYMHKLIATLFRPGKPFSRKNKRQNYQGDRRLPLLEHESTLDYRVKIIEKMPRLTKMAIMHWFASCRETITNQFAKLFKSAEDQAEKKGHGYGWAAVLLELAGTKFGDDKSTGSKPLFTILLHLSMQEDKRVEAERRAAFDQLK